MKNFFRAQNVDNSKEKRSNSEELLRHYACLEAEDVFKELESTADGISSKEAELRLAECGKNKITTGEKNTTFSRLKEAVVNPFNIVLLIIAVVTFLTDVVFSDGQDYLTVIIILILVFISSAVAFVQSEKSNQAAESLAKMISNKVDVYRDQQLQEINLEEVVPGDVIQLASGDMLPGDVKFLFTKDTFIAQSALTGESVPVEKFAKAKVEMSSVTDLENIGFMGSNLVSGSATAIVLTTGNNTYFGAMAKTLSGDRAKNSFERGVDSVSRLLINFMMVMIPIIFIINLFTKQDWLNALLFSVTMAVGLTPEMLPMIMTSTLAKGASNMAKESVIVKSLGAIQTFGEMDVLCTDKTGTLTEDKIVLEKYMNAQGEEDQRILKHAYLNSHFQTGLKNLIDVAVINRANANHLDNLLQEYKLIDEIPFDFSRRRMSVALQDKEGKKQLITKGAVDEILACCSMIDLDGKVSKLSKQQRDKAYAVYEKYNEEGLRMIAVAQRNDIDEVEVFSVADETEMVLLGFIGFLDPPKESATAAVSALQEHGVRVVVLTGDSMGVAVKVCQKVGIDIHLTYEGKDVDAMNEEELAKAIEECNLFAKLSPNQKSRVVESFRTHGHTVGYMGDGINDAPPLHQADVGISVDSAVDIAKETADIILLKKDLMVLEKGVIQGRITFGNISKYLKMATSGNFGNMFSVIIASLFLPFLPMLPVHILTQNLLCDFAQIGMPFDDVDEEYIKKPKKWDPDSIRRFMIHMGPVSSLFDCICFLVLWYVIKANTMEMAPIFQCGWFAFGTISQIVVIHMIRTNKIPFIQSNASLALYISSVGVIIITFLIGFTDFATALDFAKLPLVFIPWLLAIILLYCLAIQVVKYFYMKRFHEWY